MGVPKADLFSEKFGAMGNVVAEGVWNQLGRPELDRLTLLIRESVQNSWDARVGANIRYSLDAFSLSAPQRRAYESFFEAQPPDGAYAGSKNVAERIDSIGEWLNHPAPRMLVVSDRGTTGLDGPTRADEAVDAGANRNFVDFLRNIGQPPGRAHTGGTFGYGKAALYLASRTRTIVVYTRCTHEGRLESRLTAAALTHNFTHSRSRYTGRHWWGRRMTGEIVEPFVGEEADAIAMALGLPAFRGGDRGTSVGMTAPDFDDGELRSIGPICLRHLWPKLKAPKHARPPITLSIMVSGLSVRVPDAATTPPYDAYWRAYCAMAEGEREEVKHRSDVVGHLRLERALMLASPERPVDVAEHECHPQHVALLRTPELVVKYLDAGRSLGNDQVGFVGVFRTDPEFDQVFAGAEPPTHDDWQPSSVGDKRARSIVNTALRKIRERAREFAVPHSPRVHGAEATPLARLASQFAVLAQGAGARGAGEREDTPISERGRRERSARPKVRVGTDATLSAVEEIEGRAYAVFCVDVTHAADSQTTLLSADVYPVLSGGARETDLPTGRGKARIGWWESPRGARAEGNPLLIGPRQQGVWKLFVPLEDNVAVAVEFEATTQVEP